MPILESNYDNIPEEDRLPNSGLQPIFPEASAAQTGVENSGLQDVFSEDNPAIPRTKLQHRWSKPETETPSNYNPYGDRGLTGRQLQRIRASFEDDPLLCIEDDNARAQIEAVVARFGKDEGDHIKKAVALAHYYSMGHREKTGFIFDNLDAAIEEFEGKPMSVEQAYESVRNIYNPKQEGFYGNPVAAAVTAGGAEIWKTMINAEGFVGKRVAQGAQIAGITGVGLYSAVLRLIGAEGKAERVWESGKDMLLGRDYGQEFEDMTQRDAKTFQTIETWAQQNMNVPGDWVTNSDSIADWTANAGLSLINYMPQLGAQIGLMSVTGGVSALGVVYGINGYYDIKGDLPDVSEEEAMLYGLGVGLINGGLEKVSLGIVEGRVAEELAEAGIKKGLKNILFYLGGSALMEGAEEGLEEFAENILDIGFGRRGNTDEWTANQWKQNLFQGVPEAAFLGFTTGGFMAIPNVGTYRERAEYNERIKQFVGNRKAELDAKGELTPEEETEASVLSAAMDSNRPEQVARAARIVMMNAELRRKQEQDTAKKRYDEAEARLNKAQAELDAISDRTGQNAANRNTAVMKQRAAQTELDEARAELETARRDYVKAFPEEETDAERAKREAEEIRTKRDLKRRIGWNPQDTIDKVNELAKQYPTIPIRAVQTFDDLPEAARRDAEKRGINKNRADAVWSNGEVYVIADKTRPSDTEKRILHEVVGHEGLRRVFGNDFDTFLDDVFARHSKEIEEMGLSVLYNTKPDTKEGRRYLADEFLAKMAEQDVKPSWWKELLAQIRAYLRKVAPQLHFSDAEIEAALVRSARAMRREQELSDVAPESRFALIGSSGAISNLGRDNPNREINLDNAEKATRMRDYGYSDKEIWLATGWTRGADGQWRMEIPDLNVKTDELTQGDNYNALIDYNGSLDGYVDAPEIFEAYPQLKQYNVMFIPLPRGEGGYFDRANNTIAINRTLFVDQNFDVLNDMAADMKEAKTQHEADIIHANIKEELDTFAEGIRNTLIHEVQHAIQQIEGFARGGNLEDAKNLPDDLDPMFVRANTQLSELEQRYNDAFDKLIQAEAYLDWSDEMSLALSRYVGSNPKSSDLEIIRNGAAGNPHLDSFIEALEHFKRVDFEKNVANLDVVSSKGSFGRYRRFAGEVEARNAEQRAAMSDARRRETMPSETEDVPRENQIVRFSVAETGEDVRFSIRQEPPPKKTLKGYKVFAVFKNKPGLYPPMVANPGGEATPVAVWLNADAAPRAEDSKTGRPRVQAGGKGTNTGKQTLAFRPGWHLGEVPVANQFMRTNPETGEKDLFPDNFVWAECEIAADVDYQEEAMSYGKKENGKFQHSLAGLPRVPKDGFYRYRTNPDPKTDPWLITGAMKVTRILDDADVEAILKENGREPYKRQGGPIDLAAFGLKKGDTDGHTRFSVTGADNNLIAVHNVTEQKLRDAIKLGALPVPSIGIIDAEKSNFTDYGAITLIGDRDLIDPKNKKNKVFDSDIYSPTRPNIQRLYTDEEYDRALEVMEKYDQPSEIHDPLKRIVENHKYNYDDSDFESDLKNSVAAKNWYSQTKQDDEDFESWWQRVAAPELNLHPTGRIFDGFTNSGRRRYLPANLETIVKLMTRKVRDAEGFFYGFGNVRSNVSKQFKSIAEIQKSRDKIVSNEDYKTIKKEVQEEYYALLDDIEHAIVGGRVARSREAAEDLLRAMAEGTRKQQNREWLEMALGRENPIYQDMADFLTKLKNMPTRIFEAKPQRAVYLDEFRAAVVPEGTSRDILNALEQAGVDVFTYANEEARRATLQMVTKEKNLRFSLDNMSEEDKSDLVKLLKPKWNEEAFVEPSEVKAYLESIGETGVDENEAWSLYQMAGAAIRADNKRAKERARDKWIEQNYDLIAKVSEFTSNRGLLDFVIRPSFRFKDNDEWPGTFIAEAWRKKGKKPKQFARESDLHYRERLRKRDEALEHADGKASDELAQEIADKYGGDPLDIEEKLIETFRYLKKTDLYRAYSKFMSEQNYRTRQENEIAEAEYAEYKREQIEQTVADMLENGKQITEEWAMANPEVFAELYRQLMHSEPPKSRKPSKENLEAMNAALANKDINAETYKAAKRAAVAEYQKKLTALRQEMNDRNVNAMKLQRDAAAFAEEHLPEELRGDFTRGIIKLLEYGTSPSKNYPEGKRMAEFYKLQSAMLNAAQSKRTQDSIGHINEMLDAVKVKRNWKGIPVSVIPSEQARVERIRKIVNMSAASVANAIEYNNEKILELEDQSNKDFADGKVNTDTGAELQKLKDDNALLELFGNLAYRKPDSVTKAEEFLESLIRGGKAKFKSLLAEQAGRVLEMRQQAVNQITGGRNIVPENKDAKNHTPYILKNMNLGSLMHLVAAKAGVDFDSSVFGKLWRNVEDSTQKEMTSNRRLQEDFDKELEAECGITGNALEKMRKKGRFLKDAGKVVEHTGVFKIQYSRQKVIDPFDNPILQEGRSSSKVHLIPVEDYTRRVRQEDGSFEEVQCPGVRSIIRAIDNGESIEFDGVPLDETGIWFLRKQLDDYDAGIDRRLDFFVDEIDAESAEKLKADSEKDKLAVISRGKNVEEKRVEVPLSQGTALQILLTWEQEDFRPNMKWNGWSEESIEQIKKFLKPETLKLGYWMRDYFAKQRGELDAAVVKRYGAHLPENQNYWPGRFSGSRTSIGTGGMRGAGTMSINPSFLIARKFHLNPLDMETDAFSVFFDGQIKQDHFLAWTDAIRDLREVIGNTDVQNAINDNFGKDVTKNLVERIVTIAQGGTENGGFISSLFSRLNRHWILAKIALNPSSFIKQILGSMAYLNNIPVRDYVKYMSRANFTNADYRAFVEMALKSDYLKNRMAGGLDKDLIYLMQNTRDTVPYSPFADSLISGSTFLTKRADRWSALHGGFAIYQYTLDQARKSGLTEKDAQERARRAWMRATDETQQSGYLKDLNYFQQNQGLVRFYTAFLSNPIQVMNLELQTLNEIKYDPKNEAAKKRLVKQLFVNHLIVPTLMQFTTDMVRAGFSPSEWWDDSEFEDYFIAWLFGPFEGLFMLGKEGMSLLNWLGNKTLGRKGVTTQPTSAVQILDEGKQNANRFWNDIKDGEITQKDIADGLSIAGDIGMIYGALPLPGAAEAGSAGTVTNASGTLYKRILKIAGEDEEKSGKSGKKKKRR